MPFGGQYRKSKFKLSWKRVLAFLLIAWVLRLLMVGAIYVWYSDHRMPETLFAVQRSTELCLGCGTQCSVRYVSLCDVTRFVSRKPKTPTDPPENKADQERCNHLFTGIYGDEIAFDLETFALKRWSSRLPDDEQFWENPALIRSLAEVYALDVDQCVALYSHIYILRQRRQIPPAIQKALSGTNTAEFTRLLRESYEATRGKLPKGKPPKPPVEMNPSSEKVSRLLYALVHLLLLLGILFSVVSLLAMAGSSPRRKMRVRCA
jgi:hypothetical protein